MRRPLLVAVGGLLVLFVACLLVVAYATRESPAPRPAPPVEAAASADFAPPAPTLPAVAVPPPLAPVPAAAVQPSPPGWGEAQLVQLPDGTVARELAPPLTVCFERGAPARAPALRLFMEGVSGGLRVVDALPASEDSAAASLVSCAQDVLRGRKVSMGGVQVGDRYEASYPITPPRPQRDRADPQGGRGASSAGSGRVFQRQRGKGTAAPVR